MMDPECLDGFFASSPLFGAHSPHGGNSSLGSLADDSSADHNFDAQLMFAHSNQLGHQQHKPELLLQSQEHTAVHSPVAPPELNLCDSFHPLTAAHAPYPPQQMLWQPAPMTVSTHVPIIEQPVHYASSRASSGSNASGHSTPTLVAASSPTPTGHKPSLLDQLSCHVPDVAAGANSVLFAPVTSKAKREKRVTIKKESKTAAAATPTTSAAAAAATAMAEKNLPTFVASSHHMHLMAPQQPQHLPLYAPLMHSSASFVSASSSSSSPSSAPSRALSTSPAVSMDDDSNNEPSPNDDDATKKLKLARKAELARLSRKRKKTRLTDLEAEVRHLEVELEKCKKSKLDAQEASHQAAMAHQAHLAADALTEQKMNAVISAMTAAVHHGMTMTPSPVVSPSVSHRAPVLTGADAPSRAGPTALTPLIDEFMAQYNESAHNCTQHLSTLQEHHIKPLRTFEFLNALMKQNEGSSSSPSWSSLVSRELSLSSSSRELSELDGFRTSLVGQHSFDAEIDRAYTKLSSLLSKRATQQSKNLNRIRSIFSEQQFIKYIEWSHRRANTQQQQQHTPVHAPAAAAASSSSGSYEPHPQLGDFDFVPIKLE